MKNTILTQEEKEARELELLRELEELRAMPTFSKPPKPWEPRNGGWLVQLCGGHVFASTSIKEAQTSGLKYQTKQAAEKALDFGKFYMRLVALATELNPSGVAGGGYVVAFINGEWEVFYSDGSIEVTNLFETEEAAWQATDIMNRDKWENPWLRK